MKKTLAVICAALVAALIFVLPTGVLADPVTGELGDNLTYVWDSETKTITVSGEGPMADFTSGGSPFNAYAIRNNCTTVIIEEGVTTIGSYSFYNLQKVTSLTLPSTITEIHDGAFYNLKALPECDIPSGVTVIGERAFSNCQVLADVTLPAGLTSIGANAFSDCHNFTQVIIPDGITELPDMCFYQCWNVTSFTMPAGVTKAGQYVISNSSITEISIPASLTDMLFDSFGWGNSLMTDYNVDPENPAYCDIDGVLYTKAATLLMSCPLAKEGELVIDPNCIEIGPSAVDGCFGITSITIPEGVQKIGSAAFSSTGITTVVVPSTVTWLGGGVFGFCENLSHAEVYADVNDLGGSTFAGSGNLQTVVLGPNVRGYGYACFRDCYSLTSVTTIEGLTKIDEGCFNNCSSLTDFTMPDTVTEIGDNAFDGCSSLEGLYIPAGVTSLGMYAFSKTPITSAVIPEAITEIPGMLFQMCSQLTTVTVLGDLSSSEAYQVVGSNAFGKCTALETVYFRCPMPDPNKIAKNAFNGVNTKSFEIHYLNLWPEWGWECPFDSNNASYNYVADMVASYIDLYDVELRERVPADSRRDLRFIFVQVNVEGSTVNSRTFWIYNPDNDRYIEMPCRRTYYVDPDGEYELFTLVITDISPKNFKTSLEVGAWIDVTANIGNYRNEQLFVPEPFYCCVNDILGQE